MPKACAPGPGTAWHATGRTVPLQWVCLPEGKGSRKPPCCPRLWVCAQGSYDGCSWGRDRLNICVRQLSLQRVVTV